ncbi:MAG TPA: thrombospondin type 3 repeat-containing protein, partial [Bacteroidia bacterium]|nr:thrombospondin type 3 repeat-containing protein [Bacteroidia bacterium]
VTGCLVVPMGAGLNFHFGKRWTTSIGVNYTMCFTQWIDNTGLKNNSYLSANVGIQYEFKKKSSGSSDARYNNVDFANVDHLDADNDGVPDDQDDCHGTPKGVTVDKKGCPIDTDGDGVADYQDKEPNTPKGNKVDGFGVTINEEEIAKHQKEWESEAPERSKEFNVAPSKAYLDKIEAEAKKNRAKNNTASKIPAELKAADINNDGYISADEITKTIDAFFDGSSDFTVERINRLIDYFFEQ